MKCDRIEITKTDGAMNIYLPPACLGLKHIIKAVGIVMEDMGIQPQPCDEVTYESDYHKITFKNRKAKRAC